jgi:hypothetical protein
MNIYEDSLKEGQEEILLRTCGMVLGSLRMGLLGGSLDGLNNIFL